LAERINQHEGKALPWILGGDFNLLPPGQKGLLSDDANRNYRDNSELSLLTKRFRSIPAVDKATGENASQWFTYHGNDPALGGPDRTLDYLFYSRQWVAREGQVLQREGMGLSDHFPVWGVLDLADQAEVGL